MCSEWTQRLESVLLEPPTNALKCILTVACIRATLARRTLLANLAYPSLPVEIDSDGQKKFWNPFVLVGPYKFVENTFPVFMCLERIGFNFDEYQTAIVEYGIDRSSRRIFTHLGIFCGGNYYKQKMHSRLWATTESADVIPIDLSLPENVPQIGAEISYDTPFSPNTIGIADAQTVKNYNILQSKLIDSFKEANSTNSSRLLDVFSSMGHIRSLEAVPILAENLTICPQVSTNAPGGYVFPAAEALIEIGPAIGYCFGQLEKTKPLSVEESLWLRISHELYPEGLEYDLMRRAETNDLRAARLLGALPWRRLDENYEIIGKSGKP